MSKTITPKYAIQAIDQTGKEDFYTWQGKATNVKLFDHIQKVENSFNGVNSHIPKALGYIPRYIYARIVEQRTGIVKAEYGDMGKIHSVLTRH